MSRGLEITFLIHAIVALVFGLVLYLQPGLWAKIVNWAPYDASTIGGLWGLLFRGAPAFGWVSVLIWVAFAVAWIYFYVNRPAQA